MSKVDIYYDKEAHLFLVSFRKETSVPSRTEPLSLPLIGWQLSMLSLSLGWPLAWRITPSFYEISWLE